MIRYSVRLTCMVHNSQVTKTIYIFLLLVDLLYRPWDPFKLTGWLLKTLNRKNVEPVFVWVCPHFWLVNKSRWDPPSPTKYWKVLKDALWHCLLKRVPLLGSSVTMIYFQQHIRIPKSRFTWALIGFFHIMVYEYLVQTKSSRTTFVFVF